MSDEVPQLDRAFARLLAEAMRPHIKPAVDEALRDYMGSNGDQHRVDHAETIPAIAEFLNERKREKEAAEKKQQQDDKNKAEAAKETRRFRLQVLAGVIAAIVAASSNWLGKLLGW